MNVEIKNVIKHGELELNVSKWRHLLGGGGCLPVTLRMQNGPEILSC